MQETTNYKFKKPEGSDFVSPEQYNENFDVLDAQLKAVDEKVEAAASSVGKHTHAAGDIGPGTFQPGTFQFMGADETAALLEFLRAGVTDGRDRWVVKRDGTRALVFEGYSGANLATRITLTPSAYLTQGMFRVSAFNSDGTEQNGYIYGTHFPPTITGGYTGTGRTYRSISLGAEVDILIVAAMDDLSGISAISVTFNCGDFKGMKGLNGFTMLDLGGDQPRLNSNQIGISGKRLEVGSSTSEAEFFFNVAGRSYSYWGVRATT